MLDIINYLHECNGHLVTFLSWFLYSLGLDYDIRFKKRYCTCCKTQLNFLPHGILSNVQKIHYGQPGPLLPITNKLLWYVFELHDQGIVVMSHIVCHKSCDLCHDFWGKSESAKANVICRWLKSHALKYYMGTSETQRSPIDSATDALDFMQHIHPKVSEKNHDPKVIVDMDQTPIFFTCHSKKILEWKEAKSVNIYTSTNDTKRATLTIYVCADGTKFPSMLIFKRNSKQSNCRKVFPNFSSGCKYYCHENAWMDDRVVIEWVETFSNHTLKWHPKMLFCCLCWIPTNAT